MDIKRTLTNILNEPLTRRQFLLRLGALALTVVGVTALLRRTGLQAAPEPPAVSTGYGGQKGRG